MSCFVQKIFAIKSRSRQKPNQCTKFWHQFFGRDDPEFSMTDCYRNLLSSLWQSLVEFRLLLSVCEAWQ